MTLALIRDGEFVASVIEGESFDHEVMQDGKPVAATTSPAYDGWSVDSYSLKTIQPAAPVPENQYVVSVAVKIVDGVPVYVNELADVPAPDRVSARQFELQLINSGLIDSVEAWISTQDRRVQSAYRRSNDFVRMEPMMASGFAALGFSESQVDKFFADAAKL